MRAAVLRHLPHPSRLAAERRAHAHRLRRRHAAARHTEAKPVPTRVDTAVQRARHAGGPIDTASYTCGCGFVFAASVSTTVACPHCGASQAW